MARAAFGIGGASIAPGTRANVDLPFVKLYTHSPITVPIHVIHGRKDGPVLFVSACVHGDEINGIEIIRRLLQLKAMDRLRGTLIAIPVVNVLGVLQKSRYLPDRRDLNRSFPGSPNASLAGRLAHLFVTEVLERADYGIDLHTAAVHRDNFPQARGDLDNPEVNRMCQAFDTPVILNSALLDGSLRQAGAEHGVPIMVYEAAEALRFDEVAIRAGLHGVVNVMRELGMLRASRSRKAPKESVVAKQSTWVRAPSSGIVRNYVGLGARVRKDEELGVVSSPFGEDEMPFTAPYAGIVIGRANIPLANQGEALFHIAKVRGADDVEESIEDFRTTHTDDAATLGDEPPIV